MNKFCAYALLVLFVANFGLWWNVISGIGTAETLTAMHFLDVGQGDAQLIRTPAGNILIDAGRGSMTALRELDDILPISDRVIDVAVITHPQLDHMGGLKEILERYNVRLVVHTGVSYQSAAYDSLITVIREKHIPILYALNGEEIIAADGKLTILSPDTLLKGVSISPDAVNDTSIVMRYDEGDFSALFTGDISAQRERELARRIGGADILKVSHHGSKYSSAREFLAAINPAIAVIGVGKNSYGHPAAETLLRLAAIGARVLRTDLNGRVSVFVEDGRIQIATSK